MFRKVVDLASSTKPDWTHPAALQQTISLSVNPPDETIGSLFYETKEDIHMREAQISVSPRCFYDAEMDFYII